MLAVGATTKYFSKLFFIGYCSRRIMGASLYLGGNILNPAGEGGAGVLWIGMIEGFFWV